jgi:beta-aspartyl-peptidase (threonine type)
MDASIMEGDRLRNGACAAVTAIRNPISLARRILDADRHSLFVGAGAVARARALGIPSCDPAELITERRRARLAAPQPGTVGAAALDRSGALAAATSTGGTHGKLPGRVGDSALIGCGTYAHSRLGAVSCTGDGEAIIRAVLARRSVDLLAAGGDPTGACRLAVDLLVRECRGDGGLIMVDPLGRVGWAQSTALMPVGLRRPGDAGPVVPF